MDILDHLLKHGANVHYANRYVKFIAKFSDVDAEHKHHILPKSIWPQFKDFNKHPWNLSKLSVRAHYVAHMLLAKAIGGKMWSALWYMMHIDYDNKTNKKFTSKTYETCFLNKFDNKFKKRISDSVKKRKTKIDETTGLTLGVLESLMVANYLKTTLDQSGVTLSKVRSIKSASSRAQYQSDINKKISDVKHEVVCETGMTRAQIAGLKTSKTRIENGTSKGENNPQYGKLGVNHPKFGHKHSDEVRKKQSEALKGKPHKTGTCVVCGKVCSLANLAKWHNEKCKLNFSSKTLIQREF